MNRLKIYKFLLKIATEYPSGYEFPVWKDGKWKSAGQWKIEAFLSEGSSTEESSLEGKKP